MSSHQENSISETQKGSCLCGTVSFEVNGPFELFIFCHCEYCQKDTGSAHGANLISHSATLKWLSGQDNTTMFNLKGTRHTRCFCQTCGSALPYLYEGNMLVLPAGSVDSTITKAPTAHIFYDSRADWEDKLKSIERFAKFPEQ